MKRKSPESTYRAEKARVHRRHTSSHAQLMAEAKRLYEAQIEHDRQTRKGGRPRKRRGPTPREGEEEQTGTGTE